MFPKDNKPHSKGKTLVRHGVFITSIIRFQWRIHTQKCKFLPLSLDLNAKSWIRPWLFLLSLIFSHLDFHWVREVFMSSTVGKKKMGWKFDMEKEDGFKLMLHERDFIAGTTIRRNIAMGIEQSRRMIVILSRYQKIKLFQPWNSYWFNAKHFPVV